MGALLLREQSLKAGGHVLLVMLKGLKWYLSSQPALALHPLHSAQCQAGGQSSCWGAAGTDTRGVVGGICSGLPIFSVAPPEPGGHLGWEKVLPWLLWLKWTRGRAPSWPPSAVWAGGRWEERAEPKVGTGLGRANDVSKLISVKL